MLLCIIMGFPCGSGGKRTYLQCGRPGFDPWVGKIPRRRERLPSLVFWPREFHGLYSPWSHKVSVSVSCSVMPDSLHPHGLQPTRFLRAWDFPGKDTGVGCHFLLQEIFPTQGSNPGLLSYRHILYWLIYKGVTKSQTQLSDFQFHFHYSLVSWASRELLAL